MPTVSIARPLGCSLRARPDARRRCVAGAAEVTFPDLETAVPGHPDISYFDLARDIVLDLAKANGIYQGHVVVDVRHIGGPDDASSPPETVNLPGIAVLPIRSDGRDRLLLLLDFGDAADSANGFAVLALYDLSSAERLLDAANVAYDRSTWFREGASLAVSADTDAVITMSEHFNSSQGYVTTALILPRDDRLELIDTIFTFNEKLCEFRREQVPSFKVGARRQHVCGDRGDGDRNHDAVRRKLRRRKAAAGDA